MSGFMKDGSSADADGDKPRVRLVPLARSSAPTASSAPSLNPPGLKAPLMAPNMRPLTSPGGLGGAASKLTPLMPGLPGLPGLPGGPGVRPAFVRPVAPLLRGLAKPRPSLPPLLGGVSLGASLPSLRSPNPAHRPPLVPGRGANANAAALLAGMAGMDETSNAELDGIREALLQAEATEQYLAARQEEIANALLAVAGASAAMPSLESLLQSQDQDAITKVLLGAAGGGAPSLPPGLPMLSGLGAPAAAPDMDEQTKALLAALGGAPPPLPGPPAGAPDLGALLAAASGAGAGLPPGGLEALLGALGAAGAGAPPAAGAGGLEALLAAAAGGGAAPSPEALLLAAASAAGAGTGPAPSAPAPAPAPVPEPAEPPDDELDEMTKALLAAAGVDANSAGGEDVTQALLAAAVSNPAILAGATDGKEDDITTALLAAAETKKDESEGGGSAPAGGSAGSAAGSGSSAKRKAGEKSAPAPEKKTEKPASGDSGDKAKEADSLADLAAAGNVPEEMTKALLAAVATNTPSAAGDADRIIKAVLRAATASMSESTEPAPAAASRSADKKESKAPEPAKEPAAPAPQAAKATALPFEFIKNKEDAKPARPQGSMVSTEFLRAMEENAKASARTSAAKGQGGRPPAVSFSLGPAAKKLNTTKLEDDEQERLNQQLLEQAEATKAWVFFGKIPKGTSEGLIKAECAKYGTVTSILYNAEPDSLFEEPWALVSLASLESAAKAVDRLNSRLTLFGGTQQVEVRMGTPEDIAKWEDLIKAEQQVQMQQPPPLMPVPMMSPAALMAPGQAPPEMQLVAAGGLDPSAQQLAQPRRSRRKRDGSGDSRGSDRGKRRRTGSDSRSPSRDPPPLPVVQRKVYGLGGFDNASVDGDKKTPRAMAAEASLVMAPSGDRRIGTRGSWAEFVTREWEYYYVNIHTGEKRWMLPVAEMRGVAPRRSK